MTLNYSVGKIMIGNELVLQRCGQGVKLTPPPLQQPRPHAATVDRIMQLTMNFYFMDSDSVMLKMNERTAETSGYLSARDAVGKSIRDVSRQASIHEILYNDQLVANSISTLIKTETYTNHLDNEMTALSIKFPWFDGNKIAGIFGCSILLNHPHSPDLSESLSMLMQHGLLTPDFSSALSVREIDGVYLDQRDWDILTLLVRGKTAKKIARILGLSYRTIEHRLEAIKQKLFVSSKSELIELVVDYLLPL